MKFVSEDKTYIDYTHGNLGVRVWKHQCQAIRKDGETSVWVEAEDVFPVPVPDSILGFPHSGAAPTTVLAATVARYDDKECDPELRGLLKRWMTFEEALVTA